MFYWVKTPKIIQKLYRKRLWRQLTDKKEIFLTFDDGPTPEVTDWVLNVLEDYQAKATFFCVGKNVETHPELFFKIVNASHSIGNHTFSHEKSWQTKTREYIESVEKTRGLIETIIGKTTRLFRPPYGRIRSKHVRALSRKGYKIVMWDVLSGDFDPTGQADLMLIKLIQETDKGSIIVFHDSKKAFEKLQSLLPSYLEYWKEKGYVFNAIR